jgi:glutamate synthase domain-containing protein 1
MCGIVGFLAKDPSLRVSLGELIVPMLTCMGDRGPDSAGLAVFTEPLDAPLRRFSLFSAAGFPPDFRSRLQTSFDSATFDTVASHAVVVSEAPVEAVQEWLRREFPAVHLLSVGRSIDVVKDEGHPAEIARRYHFESLAGTHAVGHTRMATESAVSPAHAHPFTAGEDFCLVHNGSLSNPYSIRRKLERRGIKFETDNDTEAACRFLEWRMRDGDSLERALEQGFKELDGFYTLLMATADKLVMVRDAFACKPAVVAETDQYVAIGSEFRALAKLPGIHDAKLFEPEPEQIYSWTVSQAPPSKPTPSLRPVLATA